MGRQRMNTEITANWYQKAAMRTASGLSKDELLQNGVMGLCGEAGEVIDMVKKATFQGHALVERDIAEELGDVAWYLAICCEAIGIPLGEVMERNIAKLQARYPNGFDEERSIHRGDAT